MEGSDKLDRVVLETSLKPFRKLERMFIETVCRDMLEQWKPLIKKAKECSVLLWTADGSEILTWRGCLEDRIEWGRYIGLANEECFGRTNKDDPWIAKEYDDDAPAISYGDLKNIINIFKDTAENEFGLKLTIGATFDAGPEFAYSDFKYKLHPEVNTAVLNNEVISMRTDYMVLCPWSKLKADTGNYAGYPEGIPEGTPLGRFLGRQCRCFLYEMGFDYIWFSNGFGFSYFPWTYLGTNFDGKDFKNANYRELTDKLLSFWEEFRRECPEFRIETRGTNYGTGMDLAKDFTPLKKYYECGYLQCPPPNSPWGALNYDFGLELTGFMSRIAYTPGRQFPFRFYCNDPWFWQNPWKDCYERQPHDIYCPLSVGRLNENGDMESPTIMEFLTVDTEKGVLDEDCPLEIIPHIRKAIEDFPDQPGILTWVYPFDEYHLAIDKNTESAGKIFFNDWFMRNAINCGLPVNTVVNTRVIEKLLADSKTHILKNTILIIPTTPLDKQFLTLITGYVEDGGKVIFYGPVLKQTLKKLLNIECGTSLEGEFYLDVSCSQDIILQGNISARVKHEAVISAGGLSEILSDPEDDGTNIYAVAAQRHDERIFALVRQMKTWKSGKAAWVRGSLPFMTGRITHLPIRQSEEFTDTSVLLRYLLSDFGYTFLQERYYDNTKPVMNFVSRHDNAYLFSGYKYDTTVSVQYRFPQGIPLITGKDVYIENNSAAYTFDRAFHNECRVFIDQAENGIVSCREGELKPTPLKHNTRTIKLHNLKNANLLVYPPLSVLKENSVLMKYQDKFIELTKMIKNDHIEIKSISGNVEFSW